MTAVHKKITKAIKPRTKTTPRYSFNMTRWASLGFDGLYNTVTLSPKCDKDHPTNCLLLALARSPVDVTNSTTGARKVSCCESSTFVIATTMPLALLPLIDKRTGSFSIILRKNSNSRITPLNIHPPQFIVMTLLLIYESTPKSKKLRRPLSHKITKVSQRFKYQYHNS